MLPGISGVDTAEHRPSDFEDSYRPKPALTPPPLVGAGDPNPQLDAVVDECVTQIRKGNATVQECLARYPQWAAGLKWPLTAAARLATLAVAINPSERAKAAARRMLQAEGRAVSDNPAAS